jgi:hypothetical protein
VTGLLAPHAGHRYSGAVAAHAFSLVKGVIFDVLVVIGPLHQPIPGARGGVLTSGHDAYQTPLGLIPVDHEALGKLGTHLPLTYCERDPEHSVEIELPFAQHVLPPGFRLIPLMLREQSIPLARSLGAALAHVLGGRRVLYVASSDLSHFYDQPTAHILDHAVLDAVAHMDADGVISLEARGAGFACGRGAIAATIYAVKALGADRARVLKHATSGEVTGDYARVVGYGAVAFYRA